MPTPRETVTHAGGRPAVLFLVGMRVNRLRSVRRWWPVFTAMPTMLAELSRDPSLGLLGYRVGLESPRAVTVRTYWRDVEALHAYARSGDHLHRPAWAAFHAAGRSAAGVVGIWHETFDVPADGLESLYVAMPEQGLAAAFGSVPATGPLATAAGRLARRS